MEKEARECNSGAGKDSLLGLKLNTNKAGLEKVDKDKVNKIILEASRNSKFFENERRKAGEIEKQVADLVQRRNGMSQSDLLFASQEVANQVALMERQRDLSHYVVHVDMDAFYAAVEERDNPELKNVPVAVGSESMLSTSNYVARQFGVRAAMPGFIARKLCPNLKIIPPNFDKYKAASSLVQDVFRHFDANYRMMSLDEAYLDLTAHVSRRETSTAEYRTVQLLEPDGNKIEKVFGVDVESAVEELRTRVFVETRLTCSAGIAANCLLAKICSDKNKPNGQFSLPHSREIILDFMRNLAIRSVNGIGRVTEGLLNGLGIETCGDLFDKRNELFLLFSKTTFQYFLRVSMGLGSIPDPEEMREAQKSMSCERTFKPLSKKEDLLEVVKSLSEELSADLSKAQLYGQSLTLKLKLTSFVVRTKAVMLPYALHDSQTMEKYACKILDRYISESKGDLSVRLMGLRMARFAKKGTVSSGKKALSNNASISKLMSKMTRGKLPDSSQADCLLPVESQVHDYASGTDEKLQSSLYLFEDEEKSSNECYLSGSQRGIINICTDFCDSVYDGNFETRDVETHPTTSKPTESYKIAGEGLDNPDPVMPDEMGNSNSENAVETDSADEMFCPICGQTVPNTADINSHIDNCLAVVEVRKVLKEQAGHSNDRQKTTNPNPVNLPGSPDHPGTSKGRKRQRVDQMKTSDDAAKRPRKQKEVNVAKSGSQSSLNKFLRKR